MNSDKTEKVLVSISCLTYNHAKYIRQALDSFLMQKTNFAFEIVIYDDASTDNTQQIIREYMDKYPEIFDALLQTENQRSKYKSGMMPRFNYPRVKGKYIALCEGDDYWTDPLKLQKQVDFLEANEEYSGCFHYTPLVFEDEPHREGRLYGFHNGKLDFTAEDTIATLSPWHTSSFVFRKTAFKLPDWFSEIVSGDMATFSIVAKSGMIRCIPEEMSVYRRNAGGVTNTAAHQEATYHTNRIKLIQRLNEFHDFKYRKKAKNVIMFHKKYLYEGKVNLSVLFHEVYTKLRHQAKLVVTKFIKN